MAQVDAFGKVLFQTITANKLSASRVDKVKTYAVRCFHESSLLVKMILKCHKKATKSTKVSSLYLFDAVARHAGDAVRKKGQGFDSSDSRAPRQVNAVEDGSPEALVAGAKLFLSLAQQAAREMCLDTMAVAADEQKEKVKKVVDIWSKAHTFDAAFLADLQSSLLDPSEATLSPADRPSVDRSTTPTVDPPSIPILSSSISANPTPATSDTPHAPTTSAADSLLASLSGVLQGLKAPTAPVPAPAAPAFDVSQLSILQQLAASTSSLPQPPPVTQPPSSQQPPSASQPPTWSQPAMPSGRLRSQSPVSNWNPPPNQPLGRSDNPSDAKRARYTDGIPAPPPAAAAQQGETLATFDMSKFDPTQPTAWQRLADLWKNTYGYLPSNQEVTMCMMMGAFPPVPGAPTMNGGNHLQQQRTIFSTQTGAGAGDRGPSDGYKIPTSR